MNEDLISALDSITWYNGLAEPLIEIKKMVEKDEFQDGYSILRPNTDIFNDGQFEIFWMLLVELFGECGTSPRSGWLLKENKDKIIKFINDITKTYAEAEERENIKEED
jgi:hypothetical protein